MPTPTEFWYWTLTDRETGRRARTPCRYTVAEALSRDPTAERVPGTCEVRILPDGMHEWSNFSAGPCGWPTPTTPARPAGIPNEGDSGPPASD